MSILTSLRRYLRDAVRGRRMAGEIDEELHFHVEALVEELTARGASSEEARRIAARRFGRLDIMKDEARYAKGVGLIDDLRQDVRYGIRRLRRQPGFAVAVIVMLGFGIGVNTAIFSMVDATLLKPLPFPHGDRLFDVREVRWKGTAEETHYSGMTRSRLEEWRAQRQIFDAIGAHKHPRPAVLGDGQSIRVAQVSPGLFSLLGLSPRLGRCFTARESDDDSIVVINEGLWKRVFAEDPRAIGSRLVLDGRPVTVVGVMPAYPRFPMGVQVDAWRPLTARIDPRDPSSEFVGVVARLRAGLTPRSAQPELDRAAAAIQKIRPGREPWTAELDPIDPRRWLLDSQPVVLVVFAAVIFVLLIACANVGNLLLARAFGRQREMGIRGALGAGRLRVVRQLLVESGMLAAAGGVAAIVLAAWLIRAIPAVLPPHLVVFPVHEMQLDWRVLSFAFGTSLAVGLATGVLPAMRGSRDGMPTLLSTARLVAFGARSHRRTRNVLIAVQVAFTLVLLTGSALMIASLRQMLVSDPGYRLENLLAVSVSLPESGYGTDAQQIGFFDRLLDEVRSLPSVAAATYGTNPASAGGGRLTAEGREGNADSVLTQAGLGAGPDYFRVLGITILVGRAFTPADRNGAVPVGIVDEDVARRLWPGQNPLGKRFRYSPYVPWITVVGVAGNIRTANGFDGVSDRFEAYYPATRGATVLVRATRDYPGIVGGISARIRSLEPKARIQFAGTVEELYYSAVASPRFIALAISLFAALALLTAVVGVYAMLWYAVAQRTSEIGVRIALGATRGRVAWLVFADVVRPLGAGIVAGTVAASWLTKFIGAHLYRVSPHDPAAIGLAWLSFVLVALVAASAPARRASRIDPIAALRCE